MRPVSARPLLNKVREECGNSGLMLKKLTLRKWGVSYKHHADRNTDKNIFKATLNALRGMMV